MAEIKAAPYEQSGQPSQSALKFKAYRIFLGGSLVTRTGDWMDLVALNWAVLQYTSSPLFLGIINACRLVPVFLLSIPAGMLADRCDRRKLLICIQSGIMVLTLILSFLMAEGMSFWVIASVVTLRAAVAAMDPPVRQALIPRLIPASGVASAIALDTAVINITRMIGPALAGWLLTFTSVSHIFLLNACAAAGVIYSLSMLHSVPSVTGETKNKRDRSFKKALFYIRNHSSVQSLIILAVAPMVFGFPYTTMLPFFVEELMGLGPEMFGLLLAISSAGAVTGTIYLSIKSIHKPGRTLLGTVVSFGLALAFLTTAMDSFVLTCLTMFLIGFMSQFYRTLSRITLQMQIPDRLRGRILSVALMDRGFIPVGTIMMGAVAGYAGAFWTGIVMGGGCILTTLAVFYMRRQIWNM